MLCPNCQKEISNESVFCCFCGTVLKQPEPVQTNSENTQPFSENVKNEENKYEQNQVQINPPTNTQSHTYSTPQKDPGETNALLALIFGILSLFSGPLFAILSLVFVKEYHKTGNGSNESKVKAGKIISIISIVITVLSILAIILFYGFMFVVAFSEASATTPIIM